jgi:hypothetical protein
MNAFLELRSQLYNQLCYQVHRGTWDTYIFPVCHDSSQLPTWEMARQEALQHLDSVLQRRLYAGETIEPDWNPGPKAMAANEQVEAEQRDFIVALRKDIAESKTWAEYANRREAADPDFAGQTLPYLVPLIFPMK